MRGKVAAVLAVVAILVGAGAGFFIGNSNERTAASVSTVSVCGYATTCSTTNPLGFVLSMEINSTSVRPNGSLIVILSLYNPTQRSINLTTAKNWYLQSLSSLWGDCVSGSGWPPYGVDVFAGYLTPRNVYTARNALNDSYPIHPPLCPYIHYSGFTLEPDSSFATVRGSPVTLDMAPLDKTIQLNAIDTGARAPGLQYSQQYSLWSSKPAVYTIAVGDEWGDLALAHFSVVAAGQQMQ